jgi:F-box/leucine-rich repeat protein 14
MPQSDRRGGPSCEQPAWAHSLNLSWCPELTDEALRALSNLPALTTLHLRGIKVTDAGVLALSSLPALTSLDLRYCNNVTAAGVQALRSTTAAPSLHIEFNG